MCRPSVPSLGVLLVVLLSGCARRLPQPDVRVDCYAQQVHFEQTAGACADYASIPLAYDLLARRCDDETLARVQQRLRQEPGSRNVEVLRGPRIPGTSRHRVVIRYASSEPGTCPVDPKERELACPDCKVERVFTAMQGLPCDSRAFHRAIIREVMTRAPTCKAEQLDAARAGLWKMGWFDSVEVICARNPEGPTNILVDAGLDDPGRVCRDFEERLPVPRCTDTVATGCAHGTTCRTNWDGCKECTCVSSLGWVISILLRLPLELLAR